MRSGQAAQSGQLIIRYSDAQAQPKATELDSLGLGPRTLCFNMPQMIFRHARVLESPVLGNPLQVGLPSREDATVSVGSGSVMWVLFKRSQPYN